MSVFHFKQFDVLNERSAMKVNTDGTLLGAVAEVFPGESSILDIGTGTGTIALMVAQRLSKVSEDWHVLGIDIDTPSAEEATLNFANSPWASHMTAVCTPLSALVPSEYVAVPQTDASDGGVFDLIVSNPPYYDSSLKAPEARRNSARHVGDKEECPSSDVLSYREILEFASEFLKEGGRVAMVLPADQEKALLRHARMCGFMPWKVLRIKTVPRKNPSRIIVQFVRRGKFVETMEEELTLMDEKGRRASQQTSLLTDYLL